MTLRDPASPVPAVRMAQPLALEAEMSMARTLAAAAGEGLKQFEANEPVARLGDDIEGLHQMRVGLRRLKVAFALAKELGPDREREALRDELEWLGDVLGKARDLDVFIAETLDPLGTRHVRDAALARLRRRARLARKKAYAELRTALDSSRYAEASLRLDAWIKALDSRDEAAPALGEMAGAILDKRFRQLRKFAKRHGWQTKADLHAFRLKAKKLRYSAAFFAPLSPHRRAKMFLACVAELQDALGLAHDREVARGILVALGTRPVVDAPPRAAWRRADALVDDWHAARRHELDTRIEAAWRTLKDSTPFW